jgi:hypothetical protein
MPLRILPAALIGSLLLAGCASQVVRSEIVAYYAQPVEAAGQSFAFTPTERQRADPDYPRYEGLVAVELKRLGFVRAEPATLRVTLAYDTAAREVRVIEPQIVDPWYGNPWYGPAWSPYGYTPIIPDPLWSGPPVTVPVERSHVIYRRELKIALQSASDGRPVYQVTVRSEGRNPSLAVVMPAMIHSAFSGFPGQSGVPRIVEMTLEKTR